jgi:hypothetical protein
MPAESPPASPNPATRSRMTAHSAHIAGIRLGRVFLQYWCTDGRELFTTADRSRRVTAQSTRRQIDTRRAVAIRSYAQEASTSPTRRSTAR